MSIQTGATKVVHTVNEVVDKIEKAADEVAERLRASSDGTLDRIAKIHTHVCDHLDEANLKLDELLGSNYPPD